MFVLRRSSFRKNSSRFAKKKNYKSFSRKATPIKKMVQAAIARAAENKLVQQYVALRNLYSFENTSNFTTANIFPLGPDPTSMVITQGAGQGQRIGNRIKTKKLMYKGTLVAMPYDTVSNSTPRPMQVKMWFFYDKTVPTAVPNPLSAADFFQNGSSSRAIQGNLTDMWAPVNEDRYRVVATRTFKLGSAEYNATGGVPATNQYFTNNDFKYNCNFAIDLTKHYPKDVRFNDGTATPSTRGLFCMIEYVSATGGGFPFGTIAVSLQSMQSYTYEDA